MKKSVLIAILLIIAGCTNNGVGEYGGLERGNTEEVKAAKEKEMRGVWIASVLNINWPKKQGVGENIVGEQKKEFIQILDDVVEMNMNTVVVQIRPTADTFYPSSFEPWSKYLTGEEGLHPGWDPLEFMIEESHKRGLKFHAWFNPYRVTLKETDVISDTHPAKKNPSWIFTYGNKVYYNPGVPEAMNYSLDSVMEVVRKYDIDGVHMDDYFYPYPLKNEKLPDWGTYLKYGKEFSVAADWRRNNVDTYVETLSKRIKEIKPNVEFGISPFGVWRNSSVDSSGSETRASISNYDNLYADTRKWIKNGWIDYVAPQIYWNQGFELAEYNTLVDWWSKEVRGTPTKLYIGHAAYKIGDKRWEDPEELVNQIKYNRSIEEVDGSIFFNVDSLRSNPLNIRQHMKESVYKEKVEVK